MRRMTEDPHAARRLARAPIAAVVALLAAGSASGCDFFLRDRTETPPGVDREGVEPFHPDASIVSCGNPIPETGGDRCEATRGTGDHLLLRGRLLAGHIVYADGGLLVDRGSGRILCSGCGCDAAPEAADATVVSCPTGVISPGLINPHDHITYGLYSPSTPGNPAHRYDHRHDWRTGSRGHPRLTYPGANNSRNGVLYGELRMLLGGATSIAGSISNIDASGLLRNLDNANHTEGLEGVDVDYRTFPLGDVSGALRTGGDCSYPSLDNPNRIGRPIYMPHVAEGIDAEARNEFHCLSTDDGIPMLAENTSLVHAIGLTAEDIGRVALAGAKVVWSPRSNISLYGHTTPVSLYHRLGVTVALSTDWTISGSMNMLRELECADRFNRGHLGRLFTDRELWKMATHNAAVSMGAADQIGRLQTGYFADVAIFDGPGKSPYRTVIEAGVEDVVLVLRAGEPLHGDAELVEALVPADEVEGCEYYELCGTWRRICLMRDAGVTLAELRSVRADAYPLYFCGQTPANEPTCLPSRPGEFDGVPTDEDSSGDGIPDAEDACPGIFSPLRPLDEGVQADHDGDGIGDFCDPCPFDPDGSCASIDLDDFSGDGWANDEDNCPFHHNPGQEDTSGDGWGDVCDACPGVYSPDGAPCPLSIAAIRDPAHPDHPGEGVFVRTYGAVVTATTDRGFFMQDPAATAPDFSAIFVFTFDAPATSPGDVVNVVGRTANPFGLDQLEWGEFEVVGTQAIPEPFVVDPAEVATAEGGGSEAAAAERVRTHRFHGALLSVEDVTITHANADSGGDYGEFRVTGGLRINNRLYDFTTPEDIRVVGTAFDRIVGILNYAFDNTKLEPRGAADLDFADE
jgi:large repetitive protein